MIESLLTAFALMLLLEGFLPLVAPNTWREAFRRMLRFSDGQLRFVGLASMLGGTILLMIFQ